MKHHYVPRFYLEAFTDPATPAGQEPYLWVGTISDRIVRKRAPANAAEETDYYAFPPTAEFKGQEAEGLLSRIETAAAPVLRQLRAGNYAMSETQRGDLSYFMALSALRVPFFRSLVENYAAQVGRTFLLMRASDPQRFAHALRESHRGKRDFTDEEAEDLRRWVLNESNYTIKTNPTFSLALMFPLAPEIAGILYQMNLAWVTPAATARFVTTDNPVTWEDRTPRPAFLQGHGLLMRNVELTFPVSSSLCLLGTWEGPTDAIQVPDERVDLWNRSKVAWAERFVFSHSESLARSAFDVKQRL